jgi:hypothetical protein
LMTSAETLALIRKRFKENPQEGKELATQFQTLRSDPSSQFYAPHASGKSNYTELTSFFGVDRFDDDFYQKNAGLTQHLRYGAGGTPLAPTKKSKPEEIAAFQFYRAQKADEPTRALEYQWRALQKELSDKVSFGMDDDAIVSSIDWGKYGALKDYEANVRVRNVPMLARPVSYSEDSLYGVLAAVRKGEKVGQTDRDYLPEAADYYESKEAQARRNVQPNANKKGLPGYTAPVRPGAQKDAGLVSDAQNEPEDMPTVQPAVDPAQNKQQEKNEFNDLQYKLNQGYDLSPEQYDRWMELYPTYSHTAGKSTFRMSASGGSASDVSGGKSIRDQNEEWLTKYVGLINSGYTADQEHRMPSVEQLGDFRNMASDMGMTVEQFFTEQYGGKPEWLEAIDYGEKRKTNPELVTRMRPIDEVLLDYRSGNELSEAEAEMIWQYDKAHAGLLGGKVRGSATFSFPVVDNRISLGKTAYAALTAADSTNMTDEESNAVILSIGQDMDASFGRNGTLEDYYAANPERAAQLQAITADVKARDEEKAAQDEALRIESVKQKNKVAIDTLSAYSKGEPLDANQTFFMEYMKSAPITDADKDQAYVQAEESLLNLSYEDLVARDKTYAQYTDVTVSMEFKRAAIDALDMDVRLAKSAGISLSEMYEMFPEMQKEPGEMMDYARKAVEEKWSVADPGSVFGWLFGVNENDLAGEGVGAGTAVVKGAETGARQFGEGYMGFVRNYFTETDESTVQAWNRNRYAGPMGRLKASKDFDAAISKITDPARKEYWQNYKQSVKDVYDLPFNFADESVLNSLYENKKAIQQIQSFMLSNGTPMEYGAFMVTSSLVDNGLSMGAAVTATALTGNPTVGTAVGFGPRTAYDASEAGRAAGLPQFQRNAVGLVAAGVTAFTERIAFDKYLNMSALHGSARRLEALSMNQGAGFAKRLSAKVAFGAATIGTKIAENAGAEIGQEVLENVLNDVWLNTTGAQDKEFGAIVDDATRAAVMAGILSPFLSGQAYLFTKGGKVKITDDMRKQAQGFVESKISEAMQNPETAGKVIEAEAAANTIDALVEKGASIDAKPVEEAKQEVDKAAQEVATADASLQGAKEQYVAAIEQSTAQGQTISAQDHSILMSALEAAGTVAETAKKAYTTVNEKFQQAQAALNEQFSALFKKAKAEATAKAQNDILSEIADRNMAKADAVAEAQTVTEPAPDAQQQAETEVQPAIGQEQNAAESAQPVPDASILPASEASAPAEPQTPANVPPAPEAVYEAATGQETQKYVQVQAQPSTPFDGGKSTFVTETLPKNTNLTQEQKDLVETYRVQTTTNDAQVDRANDKISAQGYQQTVNEIMNYDFNPATPDAQALMQVAITQAAQKNDVSNLRDVLFKYAEVGSDAGQVLQARTILNRLSPEGFLTHVATSTQNDQKAITKKWNDAKQKSVDKEIARVTALGSFDAIADEFNLGKPNIKHYNRATIKQRMEAALQYARDNNGDMGKLAKDLVMIREGVPTFTNADIDYINSQMKSAKDYDAQKKQVGSAKESARLEREHNVALNRAYEASANIHAATLGEKYITLLKTNMLANVKTNVRNVQSNLLFAPMEAISQYVGAAMDVAVSKIRKSDRTVSAITPKDAFTYARNFFDEAVNTYKDYMVDKVDTSKTQIERNLHTKRTFQNPVLEAYKNITSFALALGDRPFWAAKFHMSIYQQQRLNGSTDVTQDMIDTAVAEANYAVYQEDNRVATAINALKTHMGGAGVLVDWIIPFTRTPTNIAKRMFEYSPANIVKALGWDLIHEGKNGTFDQKKFVMDMARGITGTGMMLIGAALRHGGLLKPGDDKEPDYDLIYTERAAGAQPDNTIKVGDRSYTISSVQPFSTPLLLGASLYDTFKTDTSFWSSLINGAVQSGDTLLEATFLQNLAALFSGESDSITENIASGITSSALSQMVPSLLRQTANALDPNMRDTNDTSANPLTRGVMKKLKKNLISYIPGWRNMLPLQVEITGEPVKSISGIFDNYINPLYVTTDKNDAAIDELLRLAYVAQAEDRSLSFLPSDKLYGAKNTITNGARPLTDAEKEVYKTRKGKLLFDGGQTLSESGASVTMPGLRALINSDAYKKMTDEQKANAVNGQVDAANAGVNAEYLKIVGVKEKEKAGYSPKAATSIPTYFSDNNPWYMKKLNGYYADTGDASFLPTAIGTTFSREGKDYIVPQEKVDAFYKLYDAELSMKLSNLDWSLTGQKLAEKVKSTIIAAQTSAKDKWAK